MCVGLFPGIPGLSLVWQPYLIVHTAQLTGLGEDAGWDEEAHGIEGDGAVGA